MSNKAVTKTRGQKGKSIENVVSYALGHRVRIEVLTLLNERVYSPNELSEILDVPLTTLTHHITALADLGAIELVETETAGNWTRHLYRAVEQPKVGEQEALKMPVQQRQMIAGVTMQCMTAESLAALWAGNLATDPSVVMLSWRWFNVDRQGQDEIIQELVDSWERIQEIEARATNRRAESKEEAISMIVASQGFPRCRFAPDPPAFVGKPEYQGFPIRES